MPQNQVLCHPATRCPRSSPSPQRMPGESRRQRIARPYVIVNRSEQDPEDACVGIHLPRRRGSESCRSGGADESLVTLHPARVQSRQVPFHRRANLHPRPSYPSQHDGVPP
eukprot:237331-Rhodomonas_salina.1